MEICTECGKQIEAGIEIPCSNCIYCFGCGQPEDERTVLCEECHEAFRRGERDTASRESRQQ
jgi:hypothetical protein